jgi:hypothetical protein
MMPICGLLNEAVSADNILMNDAMTEMKWLWKKEAVVV